jgi:hypothetical protein
MTTFGMVWPSALFMAIAKLRWIENCFRLNLKESEISSNGDSRNEHPLALLPAWWPLTISLSITLSWNML